MPLPWKKTGVARISRLVADLQSPKHGNSLVVETGFPTSLVDLFVKNRYRLKKKKKRAPASEVSVVDTVILAPSTLASQVAVRGVIEGECLRAQEKENLEESLIEREDKIQVEESVTGSGRRRLFGTGLKMFVVVLLALSSRKLSVGITASAFMFLFLEYLGKHFLSFLKHCFRSKRFVQCKDFETPIVKDLKAPIVKDVNSPIVKEDGSADSTIGGLESSGEIQVVEPNLGIATKVEEIKMKLPNLKLMDYLDAEEDKDTCVLVLNRDSSRRARLKAKIKKIVPKKLRKKKRGKKKEEKEPESSSSEISSSYDGEVEEPELGDKQVLAIQGEPHLSPLEEHEDENITANFDEGIYSMNIQLLAIGEKGDVEEKLEMEKKGNSGYLFIFPIVLSGLMGGRVVAVLLTVSGCLVTKLVRSSVSSKIWNLGWW